MTLITRNLHKNTLSSTLGLLSNNISNLLININTCSVDNKKIEQNNIPRKINNHQFSKYRTTLSKLINLEQFNFISRKRFLIRNQETMTENGAYRNNKSVFKFKILTRVSNDHTLTTILKILKNKVRI